MVPCMQSISCAIPCVCLFIASGKPFAPKLQASYGSSGIGHHLQYEMPPNGGSPGLTQCFSSLCFWCDRGSPLRATRVPSCSAIGRDDCTCAIPSSKPGCSGLCYSVPPDQSSSTVLYNVTLTNLNLAGCNQLHACAQVSSLFSRGATSDFGPAVTVPLRGNIKSQNICCSHF